MKTIHWVAAVLLAGASMLAWVPAQAADASCQMNFQLSGWSLFYKTATGSGVVRCSNGQSLSVHLRAKGAAVYGFGAQKTPEPFVNGIAAAFPATWTSYPALRRARRRVTRVSSSLVTTRTRAAAPASVTVRGPPAATTGAWKRPAKETATPPSAAR